MFVFYISKIKDLVKKNCNYSFVDHVYKKQEHNSYSQIDMALLLNKNTTSVNATLVS